MINNNQVKVSSREATKIIESPEEIEKTDVILKSSYESIWIGGAEDVTNSNGFILKPFETLKLSLAPSDVLYAYAIKDTTVHVLSIEF